MKKITKVSVVLVVSTSILLSVRLSDKKHNIQSKTINEVNSQLTSMLADQPLRFIANQGQAGPDAKFHVQGAGHTVLFHHDKIELRRSESQSGQNEIELQFEGANQNPVIEGISRLPGVAHFYRDRDPSKWQTNVPTFGSVMYRELYSGIDMAYIGDGGTLESEFYVSTGADYKQIRMNYEGIQSLDINKNGELVLQTNLGELVEKTPYAYQEIGGLRNTVESRYVLLNDHSVGFHLDRHDPDYPVVIDPELVFITVVPGMFGGGEWATGVSQDGNGDVILVGAATRYFPDKDVIEGSNHESGLGNDGLLLKLDGTSGEVIYSALFGGSRTDYFNDITLDSDGNMYLVGLTASENFPVLNPVQDTLNGDDDAFITILSAEGVISYSTYLGGSGRDWGEGITIDSEGNIYFAGMTESDDFPVKGAFQQQHSEDINQDFPADLFIAKINSEGLVGYATYLGGTGTDRLGGIAVTSTGQVTITGKTSSADFPLKNAYQETFGGGPLYSDIDIFVTRLNAMGNDLEYSTFIGGDHADLGTDIVVDEMGYTYISGGTWSSDFPIVNGENSPEADLSDGIVVKLDNSGQPLYSKRSNVPGDDFFDGIAKEDTFLYLVGAWQDSLRFFEITTDTLLLTNYEFAAPGHFINAIHLSQGYLATANTFWGEEARKSAMISNDSHGQRSANNIMSNSNAGTCKFHFHVVEKDRYTVVIIGPRINIEMNLPGKIRVFWDENGFLTITEIAPDGTETTETTGINGKDVWDLKITGTDGDDEIDCNGSTAEGFGTEEPKVIIDGKNGNNVMVGGKNTHNIFIGGDDVDVMIGGEEYDEFHGGKGANRSDANGGNDALFIVRSLFNPPKPSKSTNISHKKGMLELPENTNIITDGGGIDTLYFSDYDTGIKLDMTILNESQVIDSFGSKLIIEGAFEIVRGSQFNDTIIASPFQDTAQLVDGNGGADVLIIESDIAGIVDNGKEIIIPGFASISYINIETVKVNLGPTGIGETSFNTSSNVRLQDPFPNPFVFQTVIQYHLGNETKVKVSIFDLSGKRINTLIDQQQAQGSHTLIWDGRSDNGLGMPNGTYIFRIESNEEIASGKMILNR